MPKPTPEQKDIKRDRATVQDAVRIVRSTTATAAAKKKATQTIARTIMDTTDLSATDDRASGGSDTPKLLASLAAVLDPGSVALSGIDVAIANAALKLDVPKSEIDEIPTVVRQRLDKLAV